MSKVQAAKLDEQAIIRDFCTVAGVDRSVPLPEAVVEAWKRRTAKLRRRYQQLINYSEQAVTAMPDSPRRTGMLNVIREFAVDE